MTKDKELLLILLGPCCHILQPRSQFLVSLERLLGVNFSDPYRRCIHSIPLFPNVTPKHVFEAGSLEQTPTSSISYM